ncbi:MAG TPA: autotransporter domain-containing protein [Pararobbsia sp.]|nr:autotransporter domain-containing protein [Pararobbsia sp.]
MLPRHARLRAYCVMTTALGAYAPLSWATCTPTSSPVGISCLNTVTTTVGTGGTTANDGLTIQIGTSSGSTTASLVEGNQNAISVDSNNSIEIGVNSTVSSNASNASGNFGKGGNTIEFASGNRLVIDAGASVSSIGTQSSAEAINPQGANNTIENNGSITATHAAAIWFDGGGPNTVINNGILSGNGTAVSSSAQLLFTNTSAGSVTGALSAGAMSTIANNGGTITGAVTAGASSVVTNDGTITGAVTAGTASTVTNNGSITGTLTAGSGSTVTLGAGSSTHALTIQGSGNSLIADATASFATPTLSGTSNQLTLTGASGTTATWGTGLATFSQITQAGAGIWSLVPTAAPAPNATIEVQAGTLELGATNLASTRKMTVDAGATLTGPGNDMSADVADNGLVDFNETTASLYNGVVSGSGAVQKDGAGTLTLTQDNTYAGPTTIVAGTLTLGAGGASGSVATDILNNGALVIDRSDIWTYGGHISGTGSITQAGSGTTILSSDNADSGVTTVAAGTLQLGVGGTSGSVAGPVVDNAWLVFDRSDTFTFSQPISGTGNVTFAGTGTTRFDTPQSYTGETDINAGTLEVDSTLASSTIELASGATLAGRGSVAGNVINSGTVAPGDPTILPSIATSAASTSALVILGNYTGNNAQIAVRSLLNAGGNGNQATDRLLVAGSLSGTSTLLVTPLAGGVSAQTGNGPTDGLSVVQAGPGSASTALTLAGGYVAGGPYQYRLFTYGPGHSLPAGMDPQLAAAGLTAYTDYRLQTVTVLSGPDPSAPTGVPVGSGPNGEAPGQLVVVPQVPAYQALPTGALAYGLALADEYHKRVGDLAPAGEDGIEAASPELFTRGKDWRANIGNGVEAAYDQHLWFAQTGAGVVVPNLLEAGDRLHVDVVLSQGGSTSEVVANQASTHFDATSIGLASTYRAPNGAYIDGVVEGVFYDNVAFNTQQRGRVGETVGRAAIASLQTGLPVQADTSTTFEPRASLTFQHVGFNSMIDVDNVTNNPGSSNSLVADIGVRMQHRWDLSAAGKPIAVAPFVSIDYANELLGANRIVAGGVDFASAGAGHFIRVGAGVSLRVGASVSAYLGFEHDMSVARSSPTGNEYVATLSMQF